MEKRLLISLALSMAVLMVFGYLFTPASDPIPAEVAPAVVAQGQTPAAPEGETPGASEFEEGALPSAGEPSPVIEDLGVQAATPLEGGRPEQDVQAASPEVIVVNTGRYVVRISNEGARLESIRLNDYQGAVGENVELIDADVSRALGWPLAIVTGDPTVDDRIESALFLAEQDAERVRLEYASDGLRVVKEYRFDPSVHSMEVEAEVTENGVTMPFSLVWQGEFGDQSIDFQAALSNVVYLEGEDFERVNTNNLDEPPLIAPTRYVGVEDQFFLALFRVTSPAAAPALSQTAIDPTAEDVVFTPRVQVPYGGQPASLYVGPKQQDALRAVDAGLVEVIDYGFFGVIVRPLLLALLWLYGYIGNFGWAIIVLTLGINFVFFPLRLKQQMSMLKMQKIQPQMRTLQDKYKKLKAADPRRQEVQAEMMGLYKKHGVNPIGGCLPLLLQMPFLFAIFSMLRTSIELRGAPWMLWIQDLAAYDPYYVLPVLMGGSMYAMQKMTPMVGDPMQVRLMRMMPLMLIVLFLRQSSGLMLYWLTGNLVGAGQQYFINKSYRTADNDKSKVRPTETQAQATEEPASAPAEVADTEDPSVSRRRRRRGRKK